METLNVARLEDFDFNGDVLIPSKDNPDKLYVVAIIAEWCGHCKKFVPEYAKLSQALNGDDKIVCCMINCSKDKPDNDIRQSEIDLAKSVKAGKIIKNFKGFPTLCFFKNGKLLEEYSGQRTADAIIGKIKSQNL